MPAKHLISDLMPAAVLGMLAVASTAGADMPAAEPAITRSAGDDALHWGGCPEFLPAGCAIAVLHGDPSQPNADVFFRVPGRSRIPLHSHTSAERMVLVAGELEVTYQGQAPIRLAPGDYAYGPAGLPHAGHCVSDKPYVLFIAFESAVDAVPTATVGTRTDSSPTLQEI